MQDSFSDSDIASDFDENQDKEISKNLEKEAKVVWSRSVGKLEDVTIHQCKPGPKIPIGQNQTKIDIFQRILSKNIKSAIVKKANVYVAETAFSASNQKEGISGTFSMHLTIRLWLKEN